MATVHPSRMGLVPHDKPKDDSSRYSKDIGPSSGRRNRHDEPRDRPPHKDRSRSKDGSRRGRSEERERRRGRSGERDSNAKDGERYARNGRGDDERERRRSPDYSAYRRPSPPHMHTNGQGHASVANARKVTPPWRVPQNMFPPRRGGQGMDFATGGDFFSSRQEQRAKSTLSIWPSSPKAPARDDSPSGKHRSSKRRKSVSSSDGDSEDERERRRRKKKERKRDRREKDHDRDEHKESRRVHHRDKSESEREDRKSRREKESSRRRDRSDPRGASGGDDRRQRRSHSHKDSSDSEGRRCRKDDRDEHRDKTSRAVTPPRSEAEEEMWVEKQAGSSIPEAASSAPRIMHRARSNDDFGGKQASRDAMEDESSDDEVGPRPANYVSSTKHKVDERAYGGALLRGEGSAMAAFLQGDTDARIPRRGEIGLTPDEIANFESVGYVMSGSRHRRMNAVRMRKENQVISAEEKRGILKLQREERERREAILRDEFKDLVQDKLKSAGVDPML